MTSSTRAVVVSVGLWLAVVAGSSSVAWVVIDRAGREVMTPPVAAARPPAPSSTTSVAQPSGGVVPSRSTPTSTPPVRDSVTVAGGTVGVSCAGARLNLRYATPSNGWSMTVEREPGTLSVAFREQLGGGESEVHATCRAGAPAFDTSSAGDAGSAGDS